MIECTECPYELEVSTEDPDASYQDAVEHVQRRHPAIEPHLALQLKGSK
ncbi:helix-turn-helix DNA-binding domain protein [Arthrobacter phage Zartrosa]|uniref:Helix-turn-helix DNA-binding domain protein n=2 Tax=Marthavirus TaxID=1980936 RepID=A0A5B8WJG2_9CAUD|nr:DNA binding protein [Arthrobacter phage Shade]YP_009884284.1 DNA binding protein [Arthrobacter phage Zartrosa]ASR80616.1 helix-turn-helix DNA binding domain protein [Arthrobacter phage Jordan]ASR80768.1 helix-turn-helix DNA binding domain protein [Arthrobacter phage Shade]QED11175.1 helix-turn-helix DNA-binding domain protein [Arthrobacter phage Zartrosa]